MVETEDEWRWTDERGVQRIVSTEELRSALVSGVLAPTTLVWREGMTAWVPALTLAAFKGARPPDAKADGPKVTKTQVSTGGSARPKPLGAGPRDSSEGWDVPAVEPKAAPASTAVADEPSLDGDTIPGAAPKMLRKARGEMQTLVGIPAVEQDGRGSAPPVAPIVVPHGENETKRSAITKIPNFGEHAPPVLPQAPKLPAVTEAQAERSPQTSGVRPKPPPPPSSDDVTLVADNPTQPFRPKDTPQPASAAKAGPRAAVSKTIHGVGFVGDLPSIPRAPALGSLVAEQEERPPKATPPKPPPPPKARVLEAAAKELVAKPSERPRSIPPPLPPRARLPSKPPPKAAPPPRKEVPKPPQRPRPEVRDDATTHPLPQTAPGPAPAVAPPEPSAGTAAAPAGAAPAATSPLPAAAATSPLPAAAPAPAKPQGKAAPITTTLVLPEGLRGPQRPLDPPTEPLPDASTEPVAAKTLASAQEPPSHEPPAHEPPSHEPPAHEPAQELPAHEPPAHEPARQPEQQPEQQPAQAPGEPARPASDPPPGLPESDYDLAQAAGLAGRTGRLPRLRDPVVVPYSSLWGGGLALVALAVVGFFAGRCSATEEPALAMAGFARIVPKVLAAPPAPEKKELRPCYVVRNPLAAWATEVMRQVPFEVGVVEGNVAVGYAKDEKQAAGVLVSPQSGKIVERFAEEKDAPVGLVAPAASGAAKFTILTAPKEDDPVRLLSLTSGARPFVLAGRRDGTLATLDVGGAEASELVGADGEDKAPDALRVRAAGDRFAFVFRRAGKVRAGWVGADRKLVGAVGQVVGSGGQVGKPGVAWNGREVGVLFADRKDDASPWEIRIGLAAGGVAPKDTVVFPLPPGGPGGDAFAPDLYGLADGRWLLVWTEGSEGARAVRAQTLDPKLVPIGDPLALSPPAGSYGQGMLVGASGYVAAVFLSKGSKAYELWGAVLQCGT